MARRARARACAAAVVLASAAWARPCLRAFAATAAAQPSGGRLKAVKSAVVVMPPVRAWDCIQSIRKSHDKSFYRWMPHINVLYPFYEDQGDTFEKAADEAERSLRALRPFSLQLGRLSFFRHSAKSCTVWAGVAEEDEAAEGLQGLHAALLAAFPDCTDLSDDPSRNISRFEPHLSLGGWSGPKKAEQAISELTKTWDPVDWVVDSVHLISRRSYEDSFRVRWEVPLGGRPRSTQELSLRYVAATPEAAATGGGGQQAPRDTWAGRKKRPAAGQSRGADMRGLPWGLFPERHRG